MPEVLVIVGKRGEWMLSRGMLRDLSHAEFIFGVYLENLIGMDTRMKDSIDLDNIIMQLFRTLIS